ncbi:alpha-N-acetylglucosaminidase-like [Topomyia yanbarensis]|uniref:alpha-N-acetylglucosaminidase-like n=1 Tax=Topomyia yanbarensis TaxID=2498891 RepID=UPI00273B4EE6|nr:alpha-N-acetylglucosaminidase-like [Topomyia yanbarensis]
MNLYQLIAFSFTLTTSLIIESSPSFSAHILQHVRTKTASEDQQLAATELIGRIIPERAKQFAVFVDGSLRLNSFKLLKNDETNGIVIITGSTGVAATKGFYHYLKYFCGCQISWNGDQLNLPHTLPDVDVNVEAISSIIYYQNVCTWSYSFTWWTWTEWRRHIDWMALQGITLSLAPFQEQIWAEVYSEFNLTQQEIDNHLSGPGFFAWQRMGNIRGWGGPLTEHFMNFSSVLQSRIVLQMRRLGMVLALPAFAGHLPVQFGSLYPKAKLSPVEVWNRFPPQYASPLFLDPVDPLFQEIGSMFLEKTIARYGTDHIYFSDPFNEIQPRSSSAKYLAEAADGIYQAMVTVDPFAVWLLQGWMFVKNPFWSDRAIKAFLTAVPIGRMLVLDLQSEQFPQYVRTNSYHGQPFVWCMLSNFGGTLGMLGSVDIVFGRIRETRTNANMTMIGTGITPEGINQNYGLYEFALEMGWNSDINDAEHWFRKYAACRYGSDDEHLQDAWSVFKSTVYSFKGLELMRGKYTFNRRPSLKLYPWIWYNETLFSKGVELLLESNATNALFRADVVDVTRQFLQNTADHIYLMIMEAYQSKNLTSLQLSSNLFQELLVDIDRLLRSDTHFLLGRWLESARAMGQTSLERQKYEYNARNQITLWGPQGQIVDYANKQWAGMVQDFFLPRWKLFLQELEWAVASNSSINEIKVKNKIFRVVELPFNTDNKRYSVEAEGDSLMIARELFHLWRQRRGKLNALPRVKTNVQKKTTKMLNG